MDAEVLKGDRGRGNVVTFNRFRYQTTRKDHLNGKWYWRCKDRCGATLQTEPIRNDNQETVRILFVGLVDHNHQHHDELTRTIDHKKRMLELMAAAPITTTAKEVYDEYAVGLNDEGRECCPTWNFMKSALERCRYESLPRVPRRFEDIEIPDSLARTPDGHNFLLHCEDGIIVLGTRRSLRRMQRCRTFYQDGTFKTCPKPFKQFFVIHGQYRGRAIPLIYALLPDKEATTYDNLFTVIKDKYEEENGEDFAPVQIITDMESGQLVSIPRSFPTTDVKTCFFHACQSWWKHIKSLGLGPAYLASERLKRFVRKMWALAFLPIPHVRASFLSHTSKCFCCCFFCINLSPN